MSWSDRDRYLGWRMGSVRNARFWPLVAVAAVVTLLRPVFPVEPLSWFAAYQAAAHGFVGAMLTLLWLQRWTWRDGWYILGVPTVLELLYFLFK